MIDWVVVATIGGPLIGAGAGVAISRAVERRARLIVYYGHTAAVRVTSTGAPFWLNTHSIVVRNTGKEAANRVRIGHAVLPNDFTIYPDHQYSVVDLPSGGNEIVVDTLVPNEHFTITYLYLPPLYWSAINTYVKSDEGFAKRITVLPQQQYARWILRAIGAFTLLGGISTLYLLIEFGRWLWRAFAR